MRQSVFPFKGGREKAILSLSLLGLLLLPLLFLVKGRSAAANASTNNAQTFLPFISKPYIPVYSAPQYVTTLELPGALCPQEVGVNPTTGIAYVANRGSDNVTLLHNGAVLGTVPTGGWPTLVSTAPNNDKAFVTNLHAGVSYFQGGNLVALIPGEPDPGTDYGEPYVAAYNPINGYLYIAQIAGGGFVQVVNGTHTIANIPIGLGWMLDVKVDPTTGLVYVANLELGMMIVIQGTSIVDTFRLGWGPDKIAIDEINGYIYAAHTSPNADYPHNISVTNLDNYQVTPIGTAKTSRRVAVDKLNNLAYLTNPTSNTVSVLRGPTLLGNLPTGATPWGVGVHEPSGYTFVTNKDSNSVTVLRNGQAIMTLPAGDDPLGVAADPLAHYVYVANETSDRYCDHLGLCYETCQSPATVTVYRIPVD